MDRYAIALKKDTRGGKQHLRNKEAPYRGTIPKSVQERTRKFREEQRHLTEKEREKVLLENLLGKAAIRTMEKYKNENLSPLRLV